MNKSASNNNQAQAMRIDKFLKVSRVLKRRTVANTACSLNRVEVNNKSVKPAHRVKVGDVVKVGFGSGDLIFEILLLNEKASKDESHLMYKILST